MLLCNPLRIQTLLGRTITPEEIGLLVQFLHTLTGEYLGRPVATSVQEHRDRSE